jgi:hypothetical protein
MSVNGADTSAFAGNGMKCLLNTFASTFIGGLSSLPAQERYERIRAPFPAGFKKTMYAYYVDKNRWRRGMPLWERVKRVALEGSVELFGGSRVEEMSRPEEPDMLYMKIAAPKGPCAVFIRNSGTEDKIGVNLRGPIEESDKLLTLGEKVFRAVLLEMKDHEKTMAKAELELLSRAANGGIPAAPVAGLPQEEYRRLLTESGVKQALLEGAYPGALLTARGRWYYDSVKAGK